MKRYTCDHLFTGQEWIDDALLEVDEHGAIMALGPAHGSRIDGSPTANPETANPETANPETANPETGESAGKAGLEHLGEIVVPGIPNLHSHAHQRAMAGLTERSGPAGRDSFWTWRAAMYRHLGAMTPDDLEAIAAQLYVEMLEAGFTRVGEFQYLHHTPSGQPYGAPAEMTLRCLAAARHVGIAFTALPVYYAQGGFGGQPPGEDQRRFICDVDLFDRLLEGLRDELRSPDQKAGSETLGIAPHSLRAVGEANLRRLLELIDATTPVHLHIAEQVKEVDDCLGWSGSRPVAWLLDRFDVDARWCLIHATHLDDDELRRLAASRAVAGLCPVTEANLGDGIFRAAEFLEAGGSFGIGTDSHISVSPVEELRWLEYGQRLRDLGRNILAGGAEQSTARRLVGSALLGGGRALGLGSPMLGSPMLGSPVFDSAVLGPGAQADWVVLESESPQLLSRVGDAALDSWIFSGNRPCIRDVYVGGRRVVEAGFHPDRDAIARRFGATLERLRTTA